MQNFIKAQEQGRDAIKQEDYPTTEQRRKKKTRRGYPTPAVHAADVHVR